mmetsp:Transcript_14598/g.57315  ORF Transcript_14598/g.57315 Transcript_14598/m.57315 type:complete len:396 (+) Transcript_14598:623-1810(+)
MKWFRASDSRPFNSASFPSSTEAALLRPKRAMKCLATVEFLLKKWRASASAACAISSPLLITSVCRSWACPCAASACFAAPATATAKREAATATITQVRAVRRCAFGTALCTSITAVYSTAVAAVAAMAVRRITVMGGTRGAIGAVQSTAEMKRNTATPASRMLPSLLLVLLFSLFPVASMATAMTMLAKATKQNPAVEKEGVTRWTAPSTAPNEVLSDSQLKRSCAAVVMSETSTIPALAAAAANAALSPTPVIGNVRMKPLIPLSRVAKSRGSTTMTAEDATEVSSANARAATSEEPNIAHTVLCARGCWSAAATRSCWAAIVESKNDSPAARPSYGVTMLEALVGSMPNSNAPAAAGAVLRRLSAPWNENAVVRRKNTATAERQWIITLASC